MTRYGDASGRLMWWQGERHEDAQWEQVEQTILAAERLGTETGVGRTFELWTGPVTMMTISIDVPGRHGWALTYNHDDYTATSIGPVSDGDDVDLMYDDDWESFPVEWFVEPDVGRQAVKHYFDTGTRPTTVEWEINGTDRVPAE
jgi:hypothetical protein